MKIKKRKIKKSDSKKAWRDFEEAVFAFVKTLDPSAEVLFNHKVPDRDTGTLRQCDAWINAKFGGHLPISILVSCKDYNSKKLDIGDIGTFCNEVRSTGASTGVIYSHIGFTQPALDKAKANGLSCCRLYRNEPADIPQVISISQFVCTLNVEFKLVTDLRLSNFKTWNDLFDVYVKTPDGDKTILDIIIINIADMEDKACERVREKKKIFLQVIQEI